MNIRNALCSKCGQDWINCQCENFHPNIPDVEIALGALADIAFSGDMTLDIARKKAKRIYEQLRSK